MTRRATVLELEKVTKSFPAESGSLHVLDNISFEARDGQFLAAVGPSGCGKTTLLKIIMRLIDPDSGRVSVQRGNLMGRTLTHMVFQDLALFPWMTVSKNIQFPLKLLRVSQRERKLIAREKIKQVGLDGFENYYPHRLSGGMRQRVALARALASDPDLLLLDEPLAALDAQTRESLQEELAKALVNTGKTTLLVTHSIEEACFLSDRIVLLSSRPARVKKVVEVKTEGTLTERRTTTSFFELVRQIRNDLKDGRFPDSGPKKNR